ncbi:hypothetical protein BJV74DRAFT_826468 [Russula compacta]|nr:hypothetical protein BJV74DRAFT_826468 [Russula compacta]
MTHRPAGGRPNAGDILGGTNRSVEKRRKYWAFVDGKTRRMAYTVQPIRLIQAMGMWGRRPSLTAQYLKQYDIYQLTRPRKQIAPRKERVPPLLNCWAEADYTIYVRRPAADSGLPEVNLSLSFFISQGHASGVCISCQGKKTRLSHPMGQQVET